MFVCLLVLVERMSQLMSAILASFRLKDPTFINWMARQADTGFSEYLQQSAMEEFTHPRSLSQYLTPMTKENMNSLKMTYESNGIREQGVADNIETNIKTVVDLYILPQDSLQQRNVDLDKTLITKLSRKLEQELMDSIMPPKMQEYQSTERIKSVPGNAVTKYGLINLNTTS